MDYRLLYLFLIVFYSLWLLNKKFFFGKIFVIKITRAKAKCLKGNPPSSFLIDCNIIARKYNNSGYVYGIGGEKEFSLKFSKGIKESSAQRLRNVFPFEAFIKTNNPGGRKKTKW